MINHIVLFLLLVGALFQDVRTRKIKNSYNVASLIVGLATTLLTREIPIGDVIAGLVSAFVLGIVMWRMSAIRAGDAKFMWTIGVLKGLQGFWYSMAYAILAGGVIALVVILLRRDFKERMSRLWNYLKMLFMLKSYVRYENDSAGRLPFTIPLAVGCTVELVLRYL